MKQAYPSVKSWFDSKPSSITTTLNAQRRIILHDFSDHLPPSTVLRLASRHHCCCTVLRIPLSDDSHHQPIASWFSSHFRAPLVFIRWAVHLEIANLTGYLCRLFAYPNRSIFIDPNLVTSHTYSLVSEGSLEKESVIYT